MKKINLSITGCMGRMGQQLIKSSKLDKEFKIVSLTESSVVNKKISGTFNIVSSNHITNSELTKKIGEVLNKKIWLPNVPSFVLKFLYGEKLNFYNI